MGYRAVFDESKKVTLLCVRVTVFIQRVAYRRLVLLSRSAAAFVPSLLSPREQLGLCGVAQPLGGQPRISVSVPPR